MGEPELLEAGRPEPALRGPRPPRRVARLVVGLVVLAGGTAYVGHSVSQRERPRTLTSPPVPGEVRLVADAAYSDFQLPARRRTTIEITVANVSNDDIVVVGVGSGAPGLELQETGYRRHDRIVLFRSPPAVPLRHGGIIRVVLVYRITNCRRGAAAHLTLPIQVRTSRGPRIIDAAVGPQFAAGWHRTALSALCPSVLQS